jgi:hypothetical protein
MWFFKRPTSPEPAREGDEFRRLAERMRGRWYERVCKKQGKVDESRLEQGMGAPKASGADREPSVISAAGNGPSSRPAPAAPGTISKAEADRLVEQERKSADQRVNSERARWEKQQEQQRRDAQRRTIEACGLESLCPDSPELKKSVYEFCKWAMAATDCLEAAATGDFRDHLEMAFEGLPATIAQLISQRFYVLVRQIRQSGNGQLDMHETERVGRRLAQWMRQRSGDSIASIELIAEGSAFDESLCTLADPARGLGPSRRVNPLTFAVGQPDSRLFRKAVVEPDRSGEREN